MPANAPAQANPTSPPSSEPPTERASTAEARPPPEALPAKAEATAAAAEGPPQPTADRQNPAAKKAKAEARRRELLAELVAVEQELGVPAEDMRLGQVHEETIVAVREISVPIQARWLDSPSHGGGDARLRCNLIRQMVADLTARDMRGATPLLRAAGSNQAPVVRLLLQLRAHPHEVHTTTRRNAFDMANAAVHDILRDYGARATGKPQPWLRPRRTGLEARATVDGSGLQLGTSAEACGCQPVQLLRLLCSELFSAVSQA